MTNTLLPKEIEQANADIYSNYS